jgi:two-component system, chemotaxis family, chemotaxis protein CheY
MTEEERTPLPFQMPVLPPDAAEEATPAGTVLVVDDDADIRAAVREVLEDAGYAVIVAEDGQQAFEYLAHRPAPDCVVLDLWMPVMDGWSLASEVLMGRLPTVPILVVTAANAQFAYPVPPRYVLRKPFNPERLLHLVAELVETQPTGPVE